jgi:large subunit ribosomal protein L13
MIIDGKDLIVGRVATLVAKRALEGERVDVVNAEKMFITGARKSVLSQFKERSDRGDTYHGPFLPKMPDRLVKRMIRGMIPYKLEKGRKAYARVKCYIGIPANLKGKEMRSVEAAHVKKMKNLKFVSIKEICEYIGRKID